MIVLFKDTYTKTNVYALNIGYWSRMLKQMRIEKLHRIKFHYPFECRTGLPIYVCTNGQRFLRIIQYDMYEAIDYEKYTYLTVWKDVCHYQEKEFPELVICVLLTQEYKQIISQLIDYWFKDEDKKVEDLIEKIYSMQERNLTKHKPSHNLL